MLESGTREQVDRVTRALLPMKKLDVARLEAAYREEDRRRPPAGE